VFLALQQDNLIDIKEFEVNSESLRDFGIFLKGSSKFKELLGDIDLNIGEDVLVKIGILFFSYITDFLGDNFLEFLRPATILDLVMSIDLKLI
jgi:hypothetical protein